MLQDRQTRDYWLPASELGKTVTFSSVWGGNHLNYRLDHPETQTGVACWSAASKDLNQFVQFSSPNPVKFTGVTTQGRGDFDQWVKEYLVAYSLDGETWMAVDDGNVFTANSDRNS